MNIAPFAEAFDLSGKVVIVTGGARGIGASIAALFAERGARLALVDRDDAVRAAAARLGSKHLGYVADVTDEAAAIATVAQLVADAGRVDILINNAGIAKLARAEETAAAMWDETMAVNLRGTFLWAREAGKAMLAAGRGGRIVNVASQAAVVGSRDTWPTVPARLACWA
jgi:NAD(P)-dependent dehydrogenase (short-subunit alcohol dehydrogenase family)